MLGVALITSILQWKITKKIIHSEYLKLETQQNKEFKINQFSIWQKEMIDIISNLIAYTDPDIYPIFKIEKILPLLLKAQLILNTNENNHKKVNGLLNQLGKAVNRNPEEYDHNEIFRIRGEIIDSTKEIIYLPGY